MSAANNNVVVASSASVIYVVGKEATASCGESAETGGSPCTFDATEVLGVKSAEAGVINCMYPSDHECVTMFDMVTTSKAYFLNHCTEGPYEEAGLWESVVSVYKYGSSPHED